MPGTYCPCGHKHCGRIYWIIARCGLGCCSCKKTYSREDIDRATKDKQKEVIEEAEKRAAEAQKRAEEAQRRIPKAQKRAKEAEQSAAKAPKRAKVAEKRIADQLERAEGAENRAAEAQKRVEVAEKRIAEQLEQAEADEKERQEEQRKAEGQGLLRLHRRSAAVRRLRGRGTSDADPDRQRVLRPFHALRECLRKCISARADRPRILGPPQAELGPPGKSVEETRSRLADRQRAVREAATRLRHGAKAKSADADIEGIVLDRERHRNEHWRALTAAIKQLQWALAVGAPASQTNAEVDAQGRAARQTAEDWLQRDNAESLERELQRLQRFVEDCARCAAEEAPRLGSQAAEVVPSGLTLDAGWEAHQPPGGSHRLWVHVARNEARWEDPTAAPPAALYRAVDALAAFEAWEAQCSGAAAAAATDAALAAAQDALRQTPCLTPEATDEAVSALMQRLEQADAALTAEERLHEDFDALALFPVSVVLQGAMGELTWHRHEMDSLQRVLQALRRWEDEGQVVKKNMEVESARDLKVNKFRDSKADCKKLRKALVKEQLLRTLRNLEDKEDDDDVEEEDVAAVRAAKQNLQNAEKESHAALEALLELESDFPEVVRWLTEGIPHVLLPKWRAERLLSDFEIQDTIRCHNVVHRAQLDGRTYALKEFSHGNRKTWEREAARLLRAAHPHVVELLAVFEDRSDKYTTKFYIQMPWYQMGALDAWVQNEQPDARSVRRVLAQTCEAVDHLHSLGIIHCDIKPSNVLVGADGRARLFGFFGGGGRGTGGCRRFNWHFFSDRRRTFLG
mmetsp:Transcript_102515/g.177064  ORF Transcript_102515/g.177064 Transcript_102515/m.177064 type:complete len:800 (-) Transcript_102515:15-2414(-)